jgi:hypothetical protein
MKVFLPEFLVINWNTINIEIFVGQTRFERRIMKADLFHQSVLSVVMRHNAVEIKGLTFMKNHGRSLSSA